MEPAAVSTEAAPILVTRNLTKSFRRLPALKNHSVQVKQGEIVGVIGPNGSGKSTFFNLVTGFLKPNAGTVTFDGQEIQHLSAPRIVRLGVARTFQGTRLFLNSACARIARGGPVASSLSLADAVLGCRGWPSIARWTS
jgi:branched-chain amino acid transport system ATP-binding protein